MILPTIPTGRSSVCCKAQNNFLCECMLSGLSTYDDRLMAWIAMRTHYCRRRYSCPAEADTASQRCKLEIGGVNNLFPGSFGDRDTFRRDAFLSWFGVNQIQRIL